MAAECSLRMPVQNSNLVLTAETRTRDATEPSGEPETLWGRMPGKMGDRVQYTKPEGLAERKSKQKKKCARAREPSHAGGTSVARCAAWRSNLAADSAGGVHGTSCVLAS